MEKKKKNDDIGTKANSFILIFPFIFYLKGWFLRLAKYDFTTFLNNSNKIFGIEG